MSNLYFRLNKFWRETILFALLVFVLTSFYQFLRVHIFNLYIANKALAATAVILVGLSFALSGITYFTPFFKNKLAYRKQLGVIGFIVGLIHALISLFFLPFLFSFPQYFLANPLPFIFSSLTIILFTIMVVVSNFGIPGKIGAQKWRKVLRTGYLGIVFLIIHFGVLSFADWQLWFSEPSASLPPFSLIIFLFSLFVLLLRLVLFYALKKKELAHF